MEIQISRETYTKIMHWINKSSDEVSGFGKVIYHPTTKVFQVVDAFLIKQTNGAAHTDIDGASLAKLMYTSREVEGELKWWWHSHVNMAVFWSGTDTATIKELSSQGWMAATVFNKKEEMRSAVGMVAETKSALLGDETGVTIKDELPTFIMDYTDEEEVKAWDKEYDDNVQKKVYAPWTPSPHVVGGTTAYTGSGYRSRYEDEEQTLLDYYNGDYTSRKFHKEDKAQEKEDRKFYTKEGFWGYGGKAEAAAIGMNLKEYIDVLIGFDKIAFIEMEEKMEEAIKNGALKDAAMVSKLVLP